MRMLYLSRDFLASVAFDNNEAANEGQNFEFETAEAARGSNPLRDGDRITVRELHPGESLTGTYITTFDTDLDVQGITFMLERMFVRTHGVPTVINWENDDNEYLLWPIDSKEVTLWFGQLDHLSAVESRGLNIQGVVGSTVHSPADGVITRVEADRVYIDFNFNGTRSQVMLGNINPMWHLTTGDLIRTGDTVGTLREHLGRGVLELEMRQGGQLVNPGLYFDLSGMTESFLSLPFANFFERNALLHLFGASSYDINYALNLDLEDGEVYLRRLVEMIFYSHDLVNQGYTMDDILIWDAETRIVTVHLFGETILFVPEDMYEEMMNVRSRSRFDDENQIIVAYRLENQRAIVHSFTPTNEFASFHVNMGYKYSARIHLHPISRNRYIHTVEGFVSLVRYVQRNRYALVRTDRDFNNIIHIYNRNTLVTLAQLDAFGFYMGEDNWYRNRGLLNLDDVLRRYEINTDLRIAFFMGQAYHESGGGAATLEEYSRGGMPDYFDQRHVAEYFNRKYSHLGEGTLGNFGGDDGSHFRGAGYLQLTGRWNYRRFALYIGSICDNCRSREDYKFDDGRDDNCIVCQGFRLVGGRYNTPVHLRGFMEQGTIDVGQYAWESAGWYWSVRRNLNSFADVRDYRTILSRINPGEFNPGGRNTLGRRNRSTNNFYRILTGRELGLREDYPENN